MHEKKIPAKNVNEINFLRSRNSKILYLNIAILDPSEEINIIRFAKTKRMVASPNNSAPKELANHKLNNKEVSNLMICIEDDENNAVK